ncbi:MAG: amidase [Haliscomenobacter sp.]|nr:amidase [Haliscomenobacter sp.]MBK9490499.1 amidase [Haliscomenobacter sp.]
MLSYTEYRQYDATGLAELVQKKETSAAELLQTAIQRAEAVNPQINAIIHPLYESAKATVAANGLSGPFAGVPFLVKDLGLEIKDTPLRVGCKGYMGYTSGVDSYAIQKIKAAGLVIMGKTNTPEFGLTPYTEPELFGPTLNPWNLAHSPGGSSGGSAAAVAAGIVPMATASDGGGSIRIPASCCGLFGLKPTRGRISLGPIYGEMWSGAVVESCVSRSVRDTAAYLDALAGSLPGDPYQLPNPSGAYLAELGQHPDNLRIAFSTVHPLGLPVDQACKDAVATMAKQLSDLGHRVEEATPLPYFKEDLLERFLVVVAGEAAAELQHLSKYLQRRASTADVETNTYALALLGRTFKAGDFARAKKEWNEIAQRVAQFHQQYDLLLTPTLASRPIKIGALQNSAAEQTLLKFINSLNLGFMVKASIGQLADKAFGYIPWTPFANMTGQPSMNIPTLWTEENLPVGTMFTALQGREDLLLRLAAQLEKAMPWGSKMPNL